MFKRIIVVVSVIILIFCHSTNIAFTEEQDRTYIEQWVHRLWPEDTTFSPQWQDFISFPNYIFSCDPLEVTVLELCADARYIFTSVSFRLKENSDFSELVRYSSSSVTEYDLENTLFILSDVSVLNKGFSNSHETKRLSDTHFITTTHISFPHWDPEWEELFDEQEIEVVYSIIVIQFKEGIEQREKYNFSVHYNVLPVLDHAECHERIEYEEENIALNVFDLCITPLRLYPDYKIDLIDASLDRPKYPEYYFLCDSKGVSYSEYHTSLPDRILLGFGDEPDPNTFFFFRFVRDGNEYVFHSIRERKMD